MNPIIKINLPNKEVEGFWAVPTSGYGHICDEQPLPYLRKNNSDLSPRMGGEEGKNNYTEQIIPLPYGKLLKDWPIRQRFFIK